MRRGFQELCFLNHPWDNTLIFMSQYLLSETYTSVNKIEINIVIRNAAWDIKLQVLFDKVKCGRGRSLIVTAKWEMEDSEMSSLGGLFLTESSSTWSNILCMSVEIQV